MVYVFRDQFYSPFDVFLRINLRLFIVKHLFMDHIIQNLSKHWNVVDFNGLVVPQILFRQALPKVCLKLQTVSKRHALWANTPQIGFTFNYVKQLLYILCLSLSLTTKLFQLRANRIQTKTNTQYSVEFEKRRNGLKKQNNFFLFVNLFRTQSVWVWNLLNFRNKFYDNYCFSVLYI